jgi:phospholipid/cholesterol/gamma-HCH transport system permease protein
VTRVLSTLREILAVAAFLPRALAATFRGPPPVDTLLVFLRLVTTSVPVVFTVVFFSGAMLTVQAAASLMQLGGPEMSGLVVGFGGVREVFPLLAAASVAARSGAEFASELGTMKTTQQIDALEVMGVDPMRALVGPRVVAAVLGTPLCVLVACGAGMLGSQAVGAFQLGIDRGSMWMRLWSGVGMLDLYVGAAKGAVLGFLLAAVAVREGLVATGGAAGVGRATNKAVIRSMIVVCVASLLLTSLVYGRLA